MLKNKRRYGGVIPPIITPMTEDRALDKEALRRLIDFDIAGGVSGIFAMGSSGEAMMVDRDVWHDVIETSVEATKGRCDLFCGVIDASTARVIENIRIAEDLGADTFVVTPCFYLQNSGQSEVVRHYEAVARATKNNVVVYNIPGMTHVNIEPDTLREIAAIDNVVAVKDSSCDWERFQRFLYVLEDRDIAVFNGAEELCAAAATFGAQGLVPGLANFFPRMFVSLFEAARAGDVETAAKRQKDCWDVRKSLSVGKHWMSAMKYIGSRMGFGSNIASLPVEPLTGDEMAKIDAIIEPYKES